MSIEHLKGIALFLSSLHGCSVTTFQVWRAIHRRRDPLPARKADGTWIVDEQALRDWGDRQLAASTPKPRPARTGIYFIQAGDGGGIKIGTSIDVDGRVAEIQSCCPLELRILHVMPGVLQDEFALHKQFASCRIRPNHEWFHPAPELLAFIDEMKRAGEGET